MQGFKLTSKQANHITKMASGKAAGPSGILAEMLKPLGEAGVAEAPDLILRI